MPTAWGNQTSSGHPKGIRIYGTLWIKKQSGKCHKKFPPRKCFFLQSPVSFPSKSKLDFASAPNLHSHAWSWSSACGRPGDAIRVEGHGSPVGVRLRRGWGSRHRSLCVTDLFTNGTLENFQIHNFFFLMFLMSKHTPNNFFLPSSTVRSWASIRASQIYPFNTTAPLQAGFFSPRLKNLTFPVKSLLFLFLVSLYSYTECWK